MAPSEEDGMFSIIAGIAFIIVAILLWLGSISLAHGLAIFIGVCGIALLAWWGAPNGWGRRV